MAKKKKKKPKLSACLIVRDEEDFIETCLASLKPVVDEIVVVDTGSTDRTMEIARRFDARIIEIPWQEDFSAARNTGLDAAKGDWIIYLDADEELVEEDRPLIKQLIADKQQNCYYVNVVNLLGQTEETAKRTEFPSVRLFRNIPQYRFKGRIHENLAPPSGYDEAPPTTVRIIHRGYLDTVVGKRQKHQRNENLLLRAGEQHDAQYEQLIKAQHYTSPGRYQDALDIYEPLYKEISDKHKSAVVRGAIICNRALRRPEKALEWIERGLESFPDYTDLEHFRGLILLESHRYQKAIESFTAVLALGDAPAQYYSEQGIGTAGAWAGLARSYLGLGRYDIGAAALRRVLEHDPKHSLAVHQLGSILLRVGHPWDAIRADLSSRADLADPAVQAVMTRLESGDLRPAEG